tara:strand:+ start:100 stop:645 length:546 start_codon:yes stop_codon:yes gene_type:complete
MIIGLFFGSFNPIHNGHIDISNEVIHKSDIDKVWMVLSPQSPHKKEVLDKNIRLELMKVALSKHKNISVSTIEFDMPIPNYTCNTLKKLSIEFPSLRFKIIMGDDNYKKLKEWKDYKYIISNFEIIVYPRNELSHKSIFSEKIFNISSSKIRSNIRNKKCISDYLPVEVEKKIIDYKLYFK